MNWIPLSLIAATSLLAVDYHSFMRDPTYSGKTLSSQSGGYIQTKNLRIQGKQISIVKENGETIIRAKQQVAFLYRGHLLLSDTLHYNITKEEGSATGIRGCYNIYCVHARVGVFKNNGNIIFQNATLVPEDGLKSAFSISAKSVTLTPNDTVKASRILLQTGQVPILYLPKYTYSLKENESSPFTYGLRWITGQGPELSLEYMLYASESTSVSFRGDIRPSRGIGAAIETKKSGDHSSYKTRSYLAHDTFYRSDNPSAKITRFRLQGDLYTEREDKVAKARLKYDIFNDRTMPEDFPSPYFEYDAVELNKITINYKLPYGSLGVRGLPKLNSFQGFAQEIPSVNFKMTPVNWKSVVFTNSEMLSYFKYTPAQNLASDVSQYDSIRFSSSSQVTAALQVPLFRVVPYVGYEFRAYSDSHKNLLLSGTYGGIVELPVSIARYTFTPYLHFDGVTSPTASPQSHPIFSIEDGVDTLRQLQTGVRQTYSSGGGTLLFDAAAMSFINQKAIGTKAVQKGKIDAQLRSNSARITTKFLWNFEQEVLDSVSIEFVSSFSPSLAASLLYMHRGDYYYRKDRRNQFILDANKTPETLFNSPLSDRRNLACAKMQYNLTDTLRFQGSLHTGFGRRNQNAYTEGFAAISKRITTHIDGSLHIGRTTRGMVGYASLKMIY